MARGRRELQDDGQARAGSYRIRRVLSGEEFGWQFQFYPRGQFALINYPTGGHLSSTWRTCERARGVKFTGLNASCWVVFEDNLYFGTEGGGGHRADTGANDNGAAFVAVGRQAFSYLGNRTQNKHMTMVGPMLESAADYSRDVRPRGGLLDGGVGHDVT